MGWTVALDSSWDPSAVAFASRAPGEDLFCFEQPDRDGFALAGLGRVARLSGSGADRFASVARQWRELAGGAVADAPDGPPGAGLVALGGVAVAPPGGSAPPRAGYPPPHPLVPAGGLARRGRAVRPPLTALAAPDAVREELVARLPTRLSALRREPLPLLDPAPAGRFQISSVAPPEHYEAAVARAVERIRAGELEKIV